jgi:hypothetical protein
MADRLLHEFTKTQLEGSKGFTWTWWGKQLNSEMRALPNQNSVMQILFGHSHLEKRNWQKLENSSTSELKRNTYLSRPIIE